VGRLFWKFLFSFWAALVASVLAVSAAGWVVSLTYGSADLPVEVGPRAEFILNLSASTLRHGGESALRDTLEEWQRHANVFLYAVDDQGHELLGRSLPDDLLARARRLAADEPEPQGARRVRRPNGTSYLLFIPLAQRSLLERVLFPGRLPWEWLPLVTAMTASFCFGAVLAWYVSRPIHHLRGAFAALADGHLETRVGPLMGRRRDEVADLGRDFDRMAQRLSTLIEAQRRLLHDVSHELRSPLARLQASIGLARQNPSRVEASLERIEREAERVDDLVGELLTLSRLEAGVEDGLPGAREKVDLVDLVAEVASDAHFEAQASRRSVAFVGDGEARAEVRPEMLHRAFENVVRNAVKYTCEDSTVQVQASVTPARDRFVVTVADRGPGVPEGELGAIFEPFYRSAAAQPAAGFGLGLAIARRAVEAHDGTVRARNRDGGGLLVEISLPLAIRRAGR
jgi:two-component system OmpR family sensor kinase